jgi:thiamine biosynthesis lipoprotein
MERHVFRAMGTSVECLLESEAEAERAFEAVVAEFERLEAILSRFRLDSDLSRLNRVGRLEACPDLLEVTELALEARERTGGRFDPTVHDALLAAGYDRTFESLALDAPSAPTVAFACRGDVWVDETAGTIELEDGVRLDFGGIGKGYAVDRACALLSAAGPCLVNAGGDLAVRGRPRDGCWPIGVETPDGTISLALEDGALATSGRDRRRWRRGGHERHHLVDPGTGMPSDSDLLRVSVAAASAVDAEVLAKALFLAGEEEAVSEAAELGLPAVLVTADGRTILAGALA